MAAAGYTNLVMFDNGQDAYDEICGRLAVAMQNGKPMAEYLGAVVTDIEMPKMDGLTLCRSIKENNGLNAIPVVIFSSLINEKMILKCKSVGADTWTNKLSADDLIHTLDKLCLAAD